MFDRVRPKISTVACHNMPKDWPQRHNQVAQGAHPTLTSVRNCRFPYLALVLVSHRNLREGNPLVYGGAVSRVEGDPAAGEVVDVIDSSGKFIAWGTRSILRFVVSAHRRT